MTAVTSAHRGERDRASPAPDTPAPRPYTLLSCSVSIDGYLDDASEERLLLSNRADFARVDGVRAQCDAILVGAHTIRRDDPRLLVRSGALRRERLDRGRPGSPVKVTVTAGGDLDPSARFFTTGEGEKLVYCAGSALAGTRERLRQVATVIDAGEPVDLRWLAADLHDRGVGQLMVEGGGVTHTRFLAAGLADELQLVIAPFFVGDSRAPRFVGDGGFAWSPQRPAVLAEVRRLGEVVLLRYALSERFATGTGTAAADSDAEPGAV